MLYYIDNENACSDELLAKHGLTDLVPSPGGRQFLGGGPGEKPGYVLHDNSFGGTPRYEKEKQVWVPRFGFPGTYVGYWKDSPPGPNELKREKIVAGQPVELLDGQRWVVPLLREWREQDDQIPFEIKLPRVLSRDEDTGRLVMGDVVRPFRDLWQNSCAIADELLEQFKGGKVVIDTDQLDSFVAALLGLNYRVSLDEIGLLGLLDFARYHEIVLCALDWHRLRELLGNLQRRLDTAGDDQASTFNSTDSGETQLTADGSMTTAQP